MLLQTPRSPSAVDRRWRCCCCWWCWTALARDEMTTTHRLTSSPTMLSTERSFEAKRRSDNGAECCNVCFSDRTSRLLLGVPSSNPHLTTTTSEEDEDDASSRESYCLCLTADAAAGWCLVGVLRSSSQCWFFRLCWVTGKKISNILNQTDGEREATDSTSISDGR